MLIIPNSKANWYLLLYRTVRARELRTPQTGKSKLGEKSKEPIKVFRKEWQYIMPDTISLLYCKIL